mmetsp:Transcript_71867/g.119044  ORF Transcript_71867/g.119044 Transcript_71867/m.119044 type:complete len:329 (+) Transcript_71867:95-1081(+)
MRCLLEWMEASILLPSVIFPQPSCKNQDSILDACQVLCQLLLHLHVHQALDQHTLRLRGASPVHALRQEADCIASHGEVLDKAQNATTILYGDPFLCGQELLKQGASNRVVELLSTRQCAHKATGKVLHQTSNLIWKPGHVVLANVGHHDVRQVVARLGGLAAVGCCHGCTGNVFGEICDLHELVLDMGSLGCAVVITDSGSRTKHDVAQTGLADVRATVVSRETLNEHSCEINLTVHEDHVWGNHNVIKTDNCLLRTKVWVALINFTILQRTKIAALPAINVGESRCIYRNCTSNGVILLRRLEARARHDKHPMRVECARLVNLRST